MPRYVPYARRSRTIAIAALCAALPCASHADIAWDYLPSVSLQGVYESNPRYTNSGAVSSVSLALDADLKLTAETPTQTVLVAPRVRRGLYFESANSDLEKTDLYLILSDAWRGERTQVGVSANAKREGVRTSEFVRSIPDPNAPAGTSDTGRIIRPDENQNFLQLAPYFSYLLTDHDILKLQAAYTIIRYTKTDITLRYDFDYLDSSMSLIHSFSPKLRSTLELSGTSNRYKQDRLAISNDTNSYGVNLSVEYDFTDKYTAGVVAGGSRTVIDVSSRTDLQTGVPCLDPGAFANGSLVLVRCHTESKNNNFVGQLFVKYSGERNESSVSIGRSIDADPYSTSTRDTLNAYIKRDITRQLYGRAGVTMFRQRSIADLLNIKRDYGRGDLAMGWRLSEHWSLEGNYSVTFDKQSGQQPTRAGPLLTYDLRTRNHLFYLQMQWQGLPHH